jgi:hypothetical protein
MWQVSHSSLFEAPRIMCGPGEPCGLWQSAQVIEPSDTGMCETCETWLRLSVWQRKQSSLVPVACSRFWPPGSLELWTAWQSTQATRFRACVLLFQ